MNTYLQHCRTTHRYLFPNNLRAARRYVRRKHNAEGRTKVNKSKGKRRTTLHMFYSRYPISTHNILATLAFLLPVCVIVVIVRKHLRFRYYGASAVDKAEHKTKSLVIGTKESIVIASSSGTLTLQECTTSTWEGRWPKVSSWAFTVD